MDTVFELGEQFGPLFTGKIQRLMQRSFGNPELRVAKKAPQQRVTELDLAVDGEITRFFRYHFPGTTLVSEETFDGEFPASDFVLIDPLDGTHNLLMGLPTFGSMLVWIQHGKPICSIVYLPVKQLLSGNGFHIAYRRQGAWQYGKSGKWKRLSVSRCAVLEKARLLIDGPSNIANQHPFIQRMKSRVERWRAPGACWSGTLVATGGILPEGADFLLSVGNKPWDNLPPALLVEEAGGRVTDPEGNPYDLENCTELIFSNGILHEAILHERRS